MTETLELQEVPRCQACNSLGQRELPHGHRGLHEAGRSEWISAPFQG